MGRKPIGDVAMSSAERVRLFRARHAVAKPPRAASEDEDRLNARVAELEAALRSRDARIKELEAGILSRDADIEKLRATITGERPQAIDWEADPRTQRLKKANQTLRATNKRLGESMDSHDIKVGRMPRKTFAALVECLHPDKDLPTREQCTAACIVLTEWHQAVSRPTSSRR